MIQIAHEFNLLYIIDKDHQNMSTEFQHQKFSEMLDFKKAYTWEHTSGPNYRARLALSQKVNRKLKTECT